MRTRIALLCAVLSQKAMSSTIWARDQVSYCSCTDVTYTHTHCPCKRCNGKAVSRSTEYRHWQEATLLASTCTSLADGCATDAMETMDLQTEDQCVLSGSDSPEVDVDVDHARQRNNDDVEDDVDLDVIDRDRDHNEELEIVSANAEVGQDVDSDVFLAVMKAFKLQDNNNFMDIIKFGRDLYCKGDPTLLQKWPKTWSACMKVIKDAGYKDPITYYVCLNQCHPNLWSLLSSQSDCCKYCHKPGTIQFYYLSLPDNVKRSLNRKMLHALIPSLGCNMNNVMYTNVSIGAIVDGSSSIQHYSGALEA